MSGTDQKFTDDVNQIVKPHTLPQGLPAQKYPAPIGTAIGAAQNPKVDSGSGIASPLTETSKADREYFTTYSLASSDGLFVIELRDVNKMKFKDANSKSVVLVFKQ